ncbi:Mitotic control protein dis3-like protein [Plasmodium coatneyi]|uniref:Mitotic control protein dis3-like protein n=1 Tax=Plasmodium coatneyi TaxID=208452 RepID=A0A1B1E2G5_9APIC|nr:Mitotic control protein dis3-like protein [Plasmodium coatneyi]ANQ09039.1 Mitotic control protein dis3-like protein [Plasmodium coatneyi]
MQRFKFLNRKNDQRVQRCFYKCSANHRITKIVREVYLRNDISCGVERCNICENKNKKKYLDGERNILILDINTIVKYIDFLYECNVDNILIPLTIYDHVRTFNKILHKKLHQLCYETEDSNPSSSKRYSVFANKFCKFTYVDENADLSTKQVQEIIKIVIWIKQHNANLKLIVVSNNKFLKDDCLKNGISCFSLYEYVKGLRRESKKKKDGAPGAINLDTLKMYFEEDMLMDEQHTKEGGVENGQADSNEDTYPMGESRQIFEPHLEKKEMIQRLRDKLIVKGIFQVICVNKMALVKITETDEVLIRGSKNMNRALHNDVVAVQILEDSEGELSGEEEEDYFEEVISPEEEQQEEEQDHGEHFDEGGKRRSEGEIPPKNSCRKGKLYGKVVGIISRGRKEYGGVIKTYEKEQSAQRKKILFFKAFNNKVPYIIIKSSMGEELKNKRVIVVIDRWDYNSKYPLGRCLSVLGICDDVETETKLIYNEYNISTKEFSESAYKCLPPNDWVIPEEEYSKRKDFRDVLTFSIDPPGCEDIDDALSVQVLEEQNVIEVGVHIADVSYFVKQNSPLDLEASKRCTTVYLINQRVEMLPKLLTTDLCSLVEGQDRLTYSCIFTFDRNYEIRDININKCIIRSNKSFSYEEAQNVIDDRGDSSPTAEALRLLNNIAKHLKKKWLNEGALELRGNSEVLFEFESNDFSKTKNLKPYVSYDTNKLIEAFMLLANRSVARIIYQGFKAASVLRRHPPPKNENLKELNDYLESIDIHDFKYGTSKELSYSINNINLKDDKVLSNILKILITKCMNEAVFISGYNVHNNEMLRHYGLAADIYTFFTSPIRRYADIMVHRVLNHIYGIEILDNKYLDVIYLNKQVSLLNEKYRNARFAGRASVEFFSYLYIKKVGNQITNAVITNLKKNGVQIYLPCYSVEGICYLKRKDGFVFDEKRKRFQKIDENNEVLFSLSFYDNIQVHVQVDSGDIKCQNNFVFIKKL